MMSVVDGTLKGRLLVATPKLADPNFHRTVVLVLAHPPEEGALGVILNRPSDTTVRSALEVWADGAAEPGVVFVGGPVQPGAVICIGRAATIHPFPSLEPVVGPVGTVDLSHDPETVLSALDGHRIFVGYSGWDAGQLEAEIEVGAWFVVDADPDDLLTGDPDGLWRSVLRRQPGKLAIVSMFPEDPSVN